MTKVSWNNRSNRNMLMAWIISHTELALTIESVVNDSCQLMWPTYAVIGWLTNPWTSALLWLVVQVIPQSFALRLKIDILVRHIKWQLSLVTAFRLYATGQYGIKKNIYIHLWTQCWDSIACFIQQNTTRHVSIRPLSYDSTQYQNTHNKIFFTTNPSDLISQ